MAAVLGASHWFIPPLICLLLPVMEWGSATSDLLMFSDVSGYVLMARHSVSAAGLHPPASQCTPSLRHSRDAAGVPSAIHIARPLQLLLWRYNHTVRIEACVVTFPTVRIGSAVFVARVLVAFRSFNCVISSSDCVVTSERMHIEA